MIENRGILIDSKNGYEIHRIRDGENSFCIPGNNTVNWLNLRIKAYNDSEHVLAIVKATIEFEAKHLRILRLDDHIRDILDSTKNKVNIVDILKALEGAIINNKNSIRYAQLTGEFNEATAMVQRLKLVSFFNLKTGGGAIEAINAQCYLHDFLKVEQIAAVTQQQLSDPNTATKEQANRLAREAMKARIPLELFIISSQLIGVQRQLSQ